MADGMVEAMDLRKNFDSAEVLKGVSFTLTKGETLVIMGGSGAGKTVLLRVVAGLIRPDGGRLRVFGRHIEHLTEEELLPIRRRMGYVFQSAALFDSLSVKENVAYPLREHTNLREAEIVDRVVRNLSVVGSRARCCRSCRPSCPAACGSAWGSPARSPSSRRCCCSTNPRPDSIRRIRGSWPT